MRRPRLVVYDQGYLSPNELSSAGKARLGGRLPASTQGAGASLASRRVGVIRATGQIRFGERVWAGEEGRLGPLALQAAADETEVGQRGIKGKRTGSTCTVAMTLLDFPRCVSLRPVSPQGQGKSTCSPLSTTSLPPIPQSATSGCPDPASSQRLSRFCVLCETATMTNRGRPMRE